MINTELLHNKLDALKISGRVADIYENNFYTIYRVNFSDDITLNKIKSRRDDIALFFNSPVDIETDAGAVLLKVKKDNTKNVSFSVFSHELGAGVNGYEIPLAIGETENGTRLYFDLCDMPHLLAAGATGSGKSVFIHNFILPTLYSCKGNLVLIDVKRVEFSMYKDIPHLATGICNDTKTALKALKNVNAVMLDRFETFEKCKCRNIKEYRENGGKMNYLIVIIDELADLVMIDGRIENEIIRISQLGRAAGIHLILATQRPDATVISGLIRANIPTRVCFAVQKATDSRIILDMSGGETLHGRGDGLFLPVGSKQPIHFKAPYIPTPELIEIIEKARHCND